MAMKNERASTICDLSIVVAELDVKTVGANVMDVLWGTVLLDAGAVESGPTYNKFPPRGAPNPTAAVNCFRLNPKREVDALTNFC